MSSTDDFFPISRRVLAMVRDGGPAQRSPEWFAMRGNRVTGSIVDPVINGKSAYTTRDKLLLEKAGMPTIFTGNVATRHGTAWEERAIKEYERRTGNFVLPMPLVQHPDHPLLSHSPDGIILRKNAPPLLMEMKCPFKRVFEFDTEIYPSYYHQVQMGISCFDTAGAHFVQYRPEGHFGQTELMTIIEVARDPDWLETNKGVIETFWADVLKLRETGWKNHPLAAKYGPKPTTVRDESDDENCAPVSKIHCMINDDD